MTKLTTFFKYPYELRQTIYTTNSIESVNKLIRKNTKIKAEFKVWITFQNNLFGTAKRKRKTTKEAKKLTHN
nr:transposase [Mesomycoplasma dispar]